MPAVAGELEIDDRVESFQKFYAAATHAKLSDDQRFALWQSDGGLAAVPPGPKGDSMARALLDKAWPRYPSLIPVLPSLARAAEEGARELFETDIKILDAGDEPLHSRLILYVGQFDDNAFSIPAMSGKPATTVMSVENSAYRRVLAHELAHTIHFQLAGIDNAFEAPVGEKMFLEGLAMRTAQRAEPGQVDADYAAMPNDHKWMPRCAANKDRIIARILPDLDKAGPDIAFKYTFGKGNTGLQREVYCAAWFAFETLLNQGHSLPELARIPEEKMAETMRAALTR
ncbi:MAG TPA: hypothetical protein VKP60_18895 [Magnetospirillaceae bacterium]|nr:hypothetical protein [Magnetospirillaceae bacterium]